MNFTKMHGAGNDYVYINCFNESVAEPSELAQFVSNRNFGIGSDGLVLICPSDVADFKMRMFNADGSEGKMCGNAARCVGKYVYDRKMTDKTEITLETLSGIKYLTLGTEDEIDGEKVRFVTIDMGKAILNPKEIPINADGADFINQPIRVDGETYNTTCVSMGNPHAVVFSDDVLSLDLEKIGPLFEHHNLFPERINTEFIKVHSGDLLEMRVWERGSGETLACGTGAGAAAVAAVLNGHCERDTEITVLLRGGELYITYNSDGTVIMKGGATEVFEGELL